MKKALIVAAIGCLSACGGSDGDDIAEDQKKSFTDFQNEVSQSVGDEAVDCGVVEAEESQVDANTCVVDAFVNGRAFHAVYERQGIDSIVGGALTGTADGDVYTWHYDSGGMGSSSVIESTECGNASVSGSVDSGYRDVFICDGSGDEPGEPEIIHRFEDPHYDFTYQITGFGPNDPWRIAVRDGEVSEVEYVGSGEPDVPMTPETAPTILDLMERIDSCSSSDECEIVLLEYDEISYFPERFYASNGEEGSGFEISDYLGTDYLD